VGRITSVKKNLLIEDASKQYSCLLTSVKVDILQEYVIVEDDTC
jgi:hypothetical protein